MKEKSIINNDLKEQPKKQPIVNNEQLIINNLQQPTINNNLTMINNILQQSISDNLKELLIQDILQQSMINNILQETISNNLKQSLINNILNQSRVNKILKEPKINNKELVINDILKGSTINKQPTIVEESKINNNSKESTINSNNEESTTNKKSKTNNNSTITKTPVCLKSKRAVLNPKTNDNKSFQYSTTISLYYEQSRKNFSRLSNIKPYIKNFNWKNINFPPTQQDYENFETNNS